MCPKAHVVLESDLSRANLASLLNPGFRERWSTFGTVDGIASRPSNFLSMQHTSSVKAVQIIEPAAVQVDLEHAWVIKLLQGGCCIRLKGILSLDDRSESRTLLVNATRGRPPSFKLVDGIPHQCKMGDLEVLICASTAEAANSAEGLGSSLSRVFVLLGPPPVLGLGSEQDAAELVPSAYDLTESFRDEVLATTACASDGA